MNLPYQSYQLFSADGLFLTFSLCSNLFMLIEMDTGVGLAAGMTVYSLSFDAGADVVWIDLVFGGFLNRLLIFK